MDTPVSFDTYTLRVPKSDARFLSALAKKMGWTKTKKRVRKSGLDLALEEVEKGNIRSFDSLEAFKAYLHEEG